MTPHKVFTVETSPRFPLRRSPRSTARSINWLLLAGCPANRLHVQLTIFLRGCLITSSLRAQSVNMVIIVRSVGFEPTRPLRTQRPQRCAYTSSATNALMPTGITLTIQLSIINGILRRRFPAYQLVTMMSTPRSGNLAVRYRIRTVSPPVKVAHPRMLHTHHSIASLLHWPFQNALHMSQPR